MGGKARAEALSAEEKSQIAKKAAEARWAARPIMATHRGSFKEEFGIDVECYVLDDPQKTAVISQRGLGRALGFSSGGKDLPRFLATKAMAALVGEEMGRKIAQPLQFQWGSRGVKRTPGIIYGFDVTLLIDLCRIIVQAETESKIRNPRVTTQAHVILNASAKSGIKGLVYALAGYDPTAEEVIAAFKRYVQEEAKKYEREFPNELYAAWYRLYDIPSPKRGKPWQFKKLTIRDIYRPLAQSSGKVLELLRAVKAKGGDRNKKLFQFLNEIGARALRIHLGRVLEMAESSPSNAEYEKKTVDRFGGQPEFNFGK
ncbi:MAG: hypothetical protein QOG51_248 [Verrucomicrobiota bacterium]